MDTINKKDVETVKGIAGDYRGIEETKDGFWCLASRALKIGLYLLTRALEDTTR
jgi:hypothetical protein